MRLQSLIRYPLFLACIVAMSFPLFVTAQELEDDPTIPVSQQGSSSPSLYREEDGRFVLKGSIQTLEAAINAEKDSVDWYNWYLSARKYITKRGGISCPPGTNITFRKNGKVEAKTLDPRCLLSIEGMNFPLPENTVLDAIILPARSGLLPPATPSEIYHRTNGYQ